MAQYKGFTRVRSPHALATPWLACRLRNHRTWLCQSIQAYTKLTLAQVEGEGLVAITARIELGAILECTHVVNCKHTSINRQVWFVNPYWM